MTASSDFTRHFFGVATSQEHTSTVAGGAIGRRELSRDASHSTRHSLPQAVNRTGTTPCCKLESRFPTRRRANLVLTKKGRVRNASPDKKRSDRKKVWICFR